MDVWVRRLGICSKALAIRPGLWEPKPFWFVVFAQYSSISIREGLYWGEGWGRGWDQALAQLLTRIEISFLLALDSYVFATQEEKKKGESRIWHLIPSQSSKIPYRDNNLLFPLVVAYNIYGRKITGNNKEREIKLNFLKKKDLMIAMKFQTFVFFQIGVTGQRQV